MAMLEEEFESAGATYEIARYGSGVYHSFTEWMASVPMQSMYDQRADVRSWESTKHFLMELFVGLPAAEREPECAWDQLLMNVFVATMTTMMETTRQKYPLFSQGEVLLAALEQRSERELCFRIFKAAEKIRRSGQYRTYAGLPGMAAAPQAVPDSAAVGAIIWWDSLEEVELVVGRDKSCDYQVSNSKVSKHHLKLRADSQSWLESQSLQLVAAGSSGCAVNGAPLKKDEQRHLQDGDRVEVGRPAESGVGFTEISFTEPQNVEPEHILEPAQTTRLRRNHGKHVSGEGPDEKVPANGDLLFQKAEKQAEEIIANAKKNREGLGRLTKLRQAKDKAEEELKESREVLKTEDFREKEEARFQKESGAKAGANPAETLQVSTQSEIDSVHKDYANNKAKTIEYAGSLSTSDLGGPWLELFHFMAALGKGTRFQKEERRELDKTHAQIRELEEKIVELDEEEQRCPRATIAAKAATHFDALRQAFDAGRVLRRCGGKRCSFTVHFVAGRHVNVGLLRYRGTAPLCPPPEEEPRTPTKRGRSQLTQDSPTAQKKTRCQSPGVVVRAKSMPVAAATSQDMSKPVPLPPPGPPPAEKTPGVPEPPTPQKQVTKTEPNDWDNWQSQDDWGQWNEWEEASWYAEAGEPAAGWQDVETPDPAPGIPPSASELEAFGLLPPPQPPPQVNSMPAVGQPCPKEVLGTPTRRRRGMSA
ncbi:K02A2.1, partial [Symbiodinium microadriaticum]